MPEDAQPVRAFWSGTITFGLVSIPVDLFAAVHSRSVSMRLVDPKGRAVGREYYCPDDGEALGQDEIVRGHPDDDGEMLVVTDEELEAIAPEMSRDIELRRFVPKEQIPPAYFNRPYYLAPSGRSTKAYHLLAETMAKTERVGIGTFVMRGHEYLVAIISDGELLRAETLRFADELRSPEDVGLPKRKRKPSRKRVTEISKAVAALKKKDISIDELSDVRADRLHEVVEDKLSRGEDVVENVDAEPDIEDDGEGPAGEVVDLMRLLKERIGGQRKSTKAAADLESMSKEELYERAKRLEIEGRSKMSKKELVRALRRSG